MAKLLDKLIAVIAEEAELFEIFLDKLRQQQKALIENNTAKVALLAAEVQGIVMRSKGLEDKRAHVIKEIRHSKGLIEDLNVVKICNIADESRSLQLKNLRETIFELYFHIEETRMRNRLLVENSLEQINHTMEIIGNISSERKINDQGGGFSRCATPIG